MVLYFLFIIDLITIESPVLRSNYRWLF